MWTSPIHSGTRQASPGTLCTTRTTTPGCSRSSPAGTPATCSTTRCPYDPPERKDYGVGPGDGTGEHVAAFSVQRLPVRSCTSTQRVPFFTNRKCSGRPISRPFKGTPSGVRGRVRSTISVLSRVSASSASVIGAPWSTPLTLRASSARLSAVGFVSMAGRSGLPVAVAQAAKPSSAAAANTVIKRVVSNQPPMTRGDRSARRPLPAGNLRQCHRKGHLAERLHELWLAGICLTDPLDDRGVFLLGRRCDLADGGGWNPSGRALVDRPRRGCGVPLKASQDCGRDLGPHRGNEVVQDPGSLVRGRLPEELGEHVAEFGGMVGAERGRKTICNRGRRRRASDLVEVVVDGGWRCGRTRPRIRV